MTDTTEDVSDESPFTTVSVHRQTRALMTEVMRRRWSRSSGVALDIIVREALEDQLDALDEPDEGDD